MDMIFIFRNNSKGILLCKNNKISLVVVQKEKKGESHDTELETGFP